MRRRTSKRTPMTVNIFSNNEINVGGESVARCVLLVAIVVVCSLAVSAYGPEAFLDLVRSVIASLLGS